MSLAVILGSAQDVVALDIGPAGVKRTNSGLLTIIAPDMEKVMAREMPSLVATTDPKKGLPRGQLHCRRDAYRF